MEKKVTYKCPKCNAEYAEHVNVITVNAKTGQVYRVPHRPQWCERCGSGLIRKVTLTDLSPSVAKDVSTQH
jgi:DNA-directed RNA polymerase subunit RPC12/RpoP